jgi:hypothetical protein
LLSYKYTSILARIGLCLRASLFYNDFKTYLILPDQQRSAYNFSDMVGIVKRPWGLSVVTSSSSSWCTRRVRCVSCSLIHEMKLVLPLSVSSSWGSDEYVAVAWTGYRPVARWGCHLDASRSACFSVGVCSLSWMGPVLRRCTSACTISRLLQFSAALPRGHAASAFVYVGVGFADRATAVVAVSILGIYGFYIVLLR